MRPFRGSMAMDVPRPGGRRWPLLFYETGHLAAGDDGSRRTLVRHLLATARDFGTIGFLALVLPGLVWL